MIMCVRVYVFDNAIVVIVAFSFFDIVLLAADPHPPP